MDTTSQPTPENTNLSSEDLGGGQGQEIGTNSIVGGDAKEVGERKSTQVETYTPEQVQAAKDFIWDNIDENGKQSMVLFSTTDSLKSNGLMLDKIHPYISVKSLPHSPYENK